RVDGRRIEVADSTLGVDAVEQARRRVDDRRQEVVLRPELGLETLVIERERHRRGDAVDELRLLLAQRVVMDERADPASLQLDHRRRAAGALLWQVEAPAVTVDETRAAVDPVGELERGVAECVGDRLAEVMSPAERDREAADRAS